MTPGTCRVCGCSERRPCLDSDGGGCSWIPGSKRTLCSRCLGLRLPETAEKWRQLVNACRASLLIHADACCGRIEAPYVDVDRCLRFLEIGEARGYHALPDSLLREVLADEGASGGPRRRPGRRASLGQEDGA